MHSYLQGFFFQTNPSQPHLRLWMMALLQLAVQQQRGRHLLLLRLLLDTDHFLCLLLHLQIYFELIY